MNNPTVEAIFGNPLIALFLIIGLGLLVGQFSLKGVGLGSSAVLFVALAFGHFGFKIPEGVGTFGLVLFVYCVGIAAGGRFFAAMRREGRRMAVLALVIVGSGAVLAVGAARWLDLPADLAAGIFAGALTSTPALAAASEALRASDASALVIGYGIAYPFGVIGVVLFVQVLPRLMKLDVSAVDSTTNDGKEAEVHTVLVEVTNPNLVGQSISDSPVNELSAFQVSRIVRDGVLVPLSYDDTFELGQILFLVGRRRDLDAVVGLIGRRSDARLARDVENERRTVLVTSKAVTGRQLRELGPLKNYGVVITRVGRLGLEFVPNGDTVVETNDTLTVVGEPEALERFARLVGHRASAIGETDLLSLSLGLALGIIVGILPFALPGGDPVTLGLAGGPLLAGLILGHFGRLGRIVGHIPRATRILLQEFGLVLFLADAGVRGGSAMGATLSGHGVGLFVAGMVVTTLPLVIGYVCAVRILHMAPLQALGGICGGMTSTPALGAITAKTESQTPVVSYATAYPVALILMTVIAKLVVQVLQ